MTTINSNPYLATTDDSDGQTINSVPYLVKLSGGAGVTQGYYYNSKFYKDSAHTTEITPKAGQLYYDITGSTLYLYNGTSYSPIGVNTVGHFLSAWNCATGKPTTDPTTMPYTYTTGDYYMADNVSSGTNYKPNGTTYTGAASTTAETGTVEENDFYFFDGTVWILLKNTAKVNDVQVNGTSILSNGVANIPIASASAAGAIKTGNYLGVNSAGQIFAMERTYAQYSSDANPMAISKGTLENVLTGKAETWTFTLSDGTTVTKSVVTA